MNFFIYFISATCRQLWELWLNDFLQELIYAINCHIMLWYDICLFFIVIFIKKIFPESTVELR
jgi:hypothetical protein